MITWTVILLGLLLAYAWAGYPAWLLLLSRRSKPEQEPAVEALPRMAVLFSAHNEEAEILKRLENLAALDYPARLVDVFVGIDGSTDRTADIAREWMERHANVHVCVFSGRRGKMAVLKDLVSRLDAAACPPAERPAVFVFTDANTLFEPDALGRLASTLADSRVGGVCGELVFHAVPGGETTEGGYWNLETRLKTAESALDSCLGANGAIYAVKSERFWRAVPDNTIVDDFVIGMKVREQGYRMVYESSARAHEDLPKTVEHEWRRRVRIGAGAYQALWLCRRCLSPRYGRFAWMFWSHKVLRWFTPHVLFALLCLAGASLAMRLRVHGLTSVTALGLAVAGLIALACVLLRGVSAPWAKPFRLLAYFIAMQAALFAGFLRFCRGNLSGAWPRTARKESDRGGL
jgi:cellulose synthase/poly-beta-1,6-N-acetylglucosamine synthase-like glycosyltransferase